MIVTDIFDKDQLETWETLCRNCGTKFIATGCIGFFSWAFFDMTPLKTYDRLFHMKDANFYIEHITNGAPGVVTVKHKRPHYFQDGDFVTFEDVKGMTEINGLEPRPVKVQSPISFSIEDTTRFGKYISGSGRVTYEKVPFLTKYNTLAENWSEPSLVQTFSIGKNNYIHEEFNHNVFMIYQKYQKQHKYIGSKFNIGTNTNDKKFWNRYEAPVNTSNELVELCVRHFKEIGNKEVLEKMIIFVIQEDELVMKFITDEEKNIKIEEFANKVIDIIHLRYYQFQPLAVLIANFCGIEVLKITGKLKPHRQLSYVNLFSTFPKEFREYIGNKKLNSEMNYTSYLHQLKEKGESDLIDQFRHIKDWRELNILCVGGGSKTMEFTKILHQINGATKGKCTIVDDALIKSESQNTNFMARHSNINDSKAKIISKFFKNKQSKLQPESINEHLIYGESERTAFKESLIKKADIIFTGLDNEDANQQVIEKSQKLGIPILVASSEDQDIHNHTLYPGFDDKIGNILQSLRQRLKEDRLQLKSRQIKYPFLRDHTVIWAIETYKMHFSRIYDELHDLKEDPEKFKASLLELISGGGLNAFASFKLELIKRLYLDDSISNFSDCVDIAIDSFQELYQISIRDLIKRHPQAEKNLDGTDFWDSMRRFPEILNLNSEPEYTKIFISCASKLYALLFCLPIPDEKIVDDIVASKLERESTITIQSTLGIFKN